MSWKDVPETQDTTKQIPETQIQTDLTALNQTLKEIRNYQGTQIQLQSKQQIELTEQLTQIEQASQRVNQAFQKTLNDLNSNNETNKEQLVATLKDAQNHFNEQTKTVNQRTIAELQKINSVQQDNNNTLRTLNDSLNQTVQGTMDQVANRLSTEIDRTHKNMSWYEIKNYLYAVIPTGLLSGLVFWLLTHFFA
ncbi:Mobilization protein MobB [Lactobacillus halodurans]|uniref:Mobilization protein MobB n=1 Tax=Companilactobacillus halodurans TaxID=2584183 RepID=A0A5P0ZSN0_9LACO|nr:Mobilization protein MobB [Companilactobacillus halodurans]